MLYNGSSVPGGNILDNGNLVFTSFYPQTYSGSLSGSGSFTVNNPTSLTLSGSVNSYSGSIIINAALGSLIFNNAAPQTLSGIISGSGTLVQAGSGTLTLNATSLSPNNYSGGTIINAGTTLSVNDIDNSGFTPTAIPAIGTVTLGGTGAKLQYTGASGATLGATAPISGTGTLDLPIVGTLEVDLAKSGTITKTSGGTLILGGTSDNASLGLTVNGGTVILNKASQSTAHAVGSTTIVNNAGTLQLAARARAATRFTAASPSRSTTAASFDAERHDRRLHHSGSQWLRHRQRGADQQRRRRLHHAVAHSLWGPAPRLAASAISR